MKKIIIFVAAAYCLYTPYITRASDHDVIKTLTDLHDGVSRPRSFEINEKNKDAQLLVLRADHARIRDCREKYKQLSFKELVETIFNGPQAIVNQNILIETSYGSRIDNDRQIYVAKIDQQRIWKVKVINGRKENIREMGEVYSPISIFMSTIKGTATYAKFLIDAENQKQKTGLIRAKRKAYESGDFEKAHKKQRIE